MAVSIDRARQFYMENRDKFPGMNMTDAVASIVRSGTLPVAAAPAEEAPPAATPTQVTAPPAPQQAPTPVPEYQNQYDLQLAAFNAANPVAPAAPQKKGPVDYAARAREAITDAERRVLERDAAVAKGAKIDPEVEKVLKDRDTRLEAQIADVDKDRQQAIWMAIAQAGMKMAQSQSPYFLQALASGMEAGLNGYSEDKAKAAEKKARLQDAKEEIALKKYDLRTQAIDKAVAQGRAVRQDVANEQALSKGALANILGEETIDEAIAAAGLQNQMTRTQIAKLNSDMANDKARLALARKAGSGGGALSTKAINAQAGLIGKQITANNQEMQDITISQQRKAQLVAQNDQLKRQLADLSNMLGYGMGMRGGMTMTRLPD